MKRIYHPYWLWEDYLNGMYISSIQENENELIEKSIKLLSDINLFDKACSKVLKKWKYSCDENLSNKNQNRNAWIGAAACSITYGAREYITRIAWSNLNDFQKYNANKIAYINIKKYERKNIRIHTNLGEKMLF